MSSVNETIVREYFEWHGFFVRQQGKSIMPNRRDEEEIDFLVVNPHPIINRNPLPFLLSSRDLAAIARAAIAIKPRHTETFSPTLLAGAPEIYRLGEPNVFESAVRALPGSSPLLKILVIPALPQNESLRNQSIELLRAKGIDAVLPFHTMLSDLILAIDSSRNYEKSDLLQLLRILKNYDFIKDPQLELFKPARKRKNRGSSKDQEVTAGPEPSPTRQTEDGTTAAN
jgi:hypothetical protein